jgi:hypothetical protein
LWVCVALLGAAPGYEVRVLAILRCFALLGLGNTVRVFEILLCIALLYTGYGGCGFAVLDPKLCVGLGFFVGSRS